MSGTKIKVFAHVGLGVKPEFNLPKVLNLSGIYASLLEFLYFIIRIWFIRVID